MNEYTKAVQCMIDWIEDHIDEKKYLRSFIVNVVREAVVFVGINIDDLIPSVPETLCVEIHLRLPFPHFFCILTQ